MYLIFLLCDIRTDKLLIINSCADYNISRKSPTFKINAQKTSSLLGFEAKTLAPNRGTKNYLINGLIKKVIEFLLVFESSRDLIIINL